ncbi:hypothetical protein GF380_06215 [Candidatus Uhrbacteria bacterium]|nr:hypothetical protein [Candidatus Uhrbacteria bacterium]
MDGKKLALKGSPSRDNFKHIHKRLNKRFYALDIDFVLVDKWPQPHIVAILDYKRPGDTVTFAEVIAYNAFINAGIKVFVVESESLKTFNVYQYKGGDYKPHPPVVKLVKIRNGVDLAGFERWELKLRNATKREITKHENATKKDSKAMKGDKGALPER